MGSSMDRYNTRLERTRYNRNLSSHTNVCILACQNPSWQSFALSLDAKRGTHITPISPLLITPGHRESNDADGGNGQYSDGLISSTSGYGKNATTVRFPTAGVIRHPIYLQVQYVVSPLRVQVRGYGRVRSCLGTREREKSPTCYEGVAELPRFARQWKRCGNLTCEMCQSLSDACVFLQHISLL